MLISIELSKELGWTFSFDVGNINLSFKTIKI
jgi:hypothetical protein